MNILCLQGSPRSEGHTAALLGALTQVLTEMAARVEVVRLSDRTIAGCRGCERCHESALPDHCIQRDDMTPLYGKVLSADALILASPVYFWHMSAWLKAFVDRLYCIADRGLSGKKMALVLTGGGDAFDGMDLIVASAERMARHCGLTFAGTLFRAPSGDARIWEPSALRRDADKIACKLTGGAPV